MLSIFPRSFKKPDCGCIYLQRGKHEGALHHPEFPFLLQSSQPAVRATLDIMLSRLPAWETAEACVCGPKQLSRSFLKAAAAACCMHDSVLNDFSEYVHMIYVNICGLNMLLLLDLSL